MFYDIIIPSEIRSPPLNDFFTVVSWLQRITILTGMRSNSYKYPNTNIVQIPICKDPNKYQPNTHIMPCVQKHLECDLKDSHEKPGD